MRVYAGTPFFDHVHDNCVPGTLACARQYTLKRQPPQEQPQPPHTISVLITSIARPRMGTPLAASFTDRHIRAIGHEACPSKCVQLSTSKSTRTGTKYWTISAEIKCRGTKRNIRDLERVREVHLDETWRARAGTLSKRALCATSQIHLVGALPFGFLRLVCFCQI